MRNLFFILLALCCPNKGSAQLEKVYLDPCMKLCVVYYSDNSSSMNSAINDVHRAAKNMVLIPQSNGYVEIGVSTFGGQYTVLCEPTSNKVELRDALETLSSMATENYTYPSGGLYEIKSMLEKRKVKNPDEIQVLIILSDYYFADDHKNAMDEIKSIRKNNVAVVVTIPQAYDGVYAEVKADAIKEMQELGAIYTGSSFQALADFFKKLKAVVPCL